MNMYVDGEQIIVIDICECILLMGVIGFFGGLVVVQLIVVGYGVNLFFLVCVEFCQQGFECLCGNLLMYGVDEVDCLVLWVEQIFCGDFFDIFWLVCEMLCLMQVEWVINCVVVVLFLKNLIIWLVNVDGIFVFVDVLSCLK